MVPVEALPQAAAWGGVILSLSAWLVTAGLSVPQHTILASGFDRRAHQILVITNWLRTLVWTLRSALLVWVLLRLLAQA